MDNTGFSPFSASRTTGRLICVWVPTGNPKMPLTCVWLEDKHYPSSYTVHFSSLQRVNEEDRRVQPCL